MLRSTGLRVVGGPGREIYLCAPMPRDHRRRLWDRNELRAATGTNRAAPGDAALFGTGCPAV